MQIRSASGAPGSSPASRGAAHPRLLDPGLLEAFGYRPGFPVGEFPADVLFEFVRGLPPAAPA